MGKYALLSGNDSKRFTKSITWYILMKKKISDFTNSKEEVEMHSDEGSKLIKLLLDGNIELDSFFTAVFDGKDPTILDTQTLNLFAKVGAHLRGETKKIIVERATASKVGLVTVANKFWSVVE